jgi:CheY-like chemotaxis protein
MDPSQLEQVILNLVVNARDAMPRGGRLAIETCNASIEEGALDPQLAPSAGSWVMLSVADDGTGISSEVIDRIFEPFFTTKDSTTGSGLGLATIHGIVSQSKGYVTVESSVEQGSIFRVFLKRSHRRVRDDEAILISDEVHTALSTASILLVEDNDDLRKSTQQILESMGYSVTAAMNGEMALAIHRERQHRFDVLVTDVIMPGMDGKQLADELRTRDPSLQVIFVSGYTDDVILARGIDREELHFLSKPVSAADLRKKLLLVLNRDVTSRAQQSV